MKIAIYGEAGSYTEQAAYNAFAGMVPVHCKYISEVFKAVGKRADLGVVPIENSIEGVVTATYDNLIGLRLNIVQEITMRIGHCLISNPGTKLPEVKRVYSHPQALGQCREYLERHGLESIPYHDTAGSVIMLKETGISDAAAIASPHAAMLYHMKILARSISTNKKNYTRFLVVSKTPAAHGEKTSVVFTARHISGALFNALGAFASNGIDLTFIQSRPVVGHPWSYNFYVDFKGDKGDPKVAMALSELRKRAKFVKVLGSYKKSEV